MPKLKPAYLIHGDDHGAVAERRASLRALAGRDGEGTSVETLAAAKPVELASAIAAIPLAMGWRVIVVDGVERWKDADVEEHLVGPLASIPPQTTVALFACEQGKTSAPASLHRAVKAAGGQISKEAQLKRWELPRWVASRARSLGIELDRGAAETLVAQVGERRQRLLRELEKLALGCVGQEHGDAAGTAGSDGGVGELTGAATAGAPGAATAGAPGAATRGAGGREASARGTIGAREVLALAASSAETEVYGLGDALLAGDVKAALRVYARLRAQGERPSGLVYLLGARLRQALSVAEQLEQGEPDGAVRRTLRMPQKAAERLMADARRAGPGRLRAALGTLADFELHARGGPVVAATGARARALDEETLMVRAITAIAAREPA